MVDFKSIGDQINQSFNDAKKNSTEESYDALADIFSSWEVQLKKTIKDLSSEDIKKAIKDLESGTAISQEDLKSIRLWIVGDADYYTKRDDDYKVSVLELNKIIAQINQIKGSEVGIENAARLRAILEDGGRVISNIAFYLEKKERLQKFDSAFANLDDEDKQQLIHVLRSELVS
ncbi:MAG: hypothetical protein HQL14_07430 [Candidatus Omnitrophica bacterium]|nr:hypothetical protein [Candidatus Omnitrophota bacterium]